MNSNPFLSTRATKPQAVPLAEATHVILGGVQYRIVGRDPGHQSIAANPALIGRICAEVTSAHVSTRIFGHRR